MNNVIEYITHSPFFWLLITVALFKLFEKLRKNKMFAGLPPIVTTTGVLFLLLTLTSVPYADYKESTWVLTFLLFPATIALAYPLIENIDVLKENKTAVSAGILAGTVVSICAVILPAKYLLASENLTLSLVPKSITTPIAIEVSKSIGGIPELTVCFVIITGLIGAVAGHRILKFFRVKHNLSIGLAIGAASHVLGTTSCIDKQEPQQAAVSGFTVVMVAICTAILAPLLIKLLL